MVRKLVDGQQRLTTLNLILARLRDRIEEPEVRADLGKRIYKNPYTGEEETPRLTLRQKRARPSFAAMSSPASP